MIVLVKPRPLVPTTPDSTPIMPPAAFGGGVPLPVPTVRPGTNPAMRRCCQNRLDSAAAAGAPPGLTVGTGSGTPPPNAAGGLIGVESGVVGTSGLGFTSTIICFSNLPEKVASAVDGQMDDSKPASGQVRAQLQSTANPATLSASNVTAYVETGVNQYLLCKNF